MMENVSRPPFEAVLRLLDHQLPAHEVALLADRLRGDELARRQTAGLLLQIGHLGELARESTSRDGHERVPSRFAPRPMPRRRPNVALVAAGSCLVAAALILCS
jgi:hypothetical protein